jgi:arylformamidase
MSTRVANFEEYHTVRHPDRFQINWREFYQRADKRSGEVRAAFRCTPHIPYGPDPHQLLNVLQPESLSLGAPVFAFVHGGGFREGHPDHYDFLAAPFLARGAVYVGVGYRLRPPATVPDAVDDVARALGWMHHHIAELGGDPSALHLGGHSAGAIIASILGTRGDWQEAAGVPLQPVRGVVCIGAPYAFDRLTESAGITPEQARELEPVPNLQQAPAGAVVAYGSREGGTERDAATMARTNTELVDAMRNAGTAASLVVMEDADHADTVRLLAEPDSVLFRAVETMIWPAVRPARP